MELADRITVLHYGEDPGRGHAGRNPEKSTVLEVYLKT